MTDILELIDNAIEGSTSVDAMRWTPDPREEDRDVQALAAWVAGEHGEGITVTFQAVTFTPVIPAVPYYPEPEMEELRQQLSAQICATFGVRPEMVGVRLCGKHWHEYRRLVAEQAAKRVRLRRMHSAYHARRR